MPGISLHTELELLTQAGLTPREALAAATENDAEMYGWRDVGRIAGGAHADRRALQEQLRRVAPPDDLRAPEATALGDACQGDWTPGWSGFTSLQLWRICVEDPQWRRYGQEKRLALSCKPLIFFGFLWLPDLGSNQGPTD